MSQGSEEKEKRGERRATRKGEQSEQPRDEDLLESRKLNIQYKRFYVDAKQNKRGRFIKIAEMGSHQNSRIILTMSAAIAVLEKIEGLKKFSDETAEDQGEKDVELKSETLTFENRRYYLDLKQNARGRFLRIAQTVSTYSARMLRSQVVIPAEGIEELLTTIQELVDAHSAGYLDEDHPATNLPETKQIHAEGGKLFFFDSGSNDRGSFLRISEVKPSSGFRNSITVPFNSVTKFRDALNEVIETFEKLPAEKEDGDKE